MTKSRHCKKCGKLLMNKIGEAICADCGEVGYSRKEAENIIWRRANILNNADPFEGKPSKRIVRYYD